MWATRPIRKPPTGVDALVGELRRADRTTTAIIVRETSILDRSELRELVKHIDHENPNVQLDVALALAKAPAAFGTAPERLVR